ncbi:reverse transcriptase domain-containing protein [Tanacetum coccineum]
MEVYRSKAECILKSLVKENKKRGLGNGSMVLGLGLGQRDKAWARIRIFKKKSKKKAKSKQFQARSGKGKCMRTRSQARRLRHHQNQQVPPHLVETPKDTMADNRTMAELLQAPTEGYEDAIVVPEIEAANFEIKHGLLTLVQNKQFFGHDKEDPHAHIRYFNKITSTLRYPNVPTTSIKLMLFPFSLEGAARIWLEKEPPRSIQTWDDLVAKFINQFFPPSKTTNLRTNYQFKQRNLTSRLVRLGSIKIPSPSMPHIMDSRSFTN